MRWIKNWIHITFGIPKRTIEKISVPEIFHQRVENTLDWIVENERIRKEWDEVAQDKKKRE